MNIEISKSKDLTNSSIDRQNILNNPYALAEIEKAAGISGIPFEGKTVLLKEQVAAFFDVTPRTIDNYIEKCGEELRQNGYEVLRGNRLKILKTSLQNLPDHEIDFVTKTTVIGVFDFRAFLNLAMLVSESDRAKLLRQAILDIVIDTINQRTGGGTKYILPMAINASLLPYAHKCCFLMAIFIAPAGFCMRWKTSVITSLPETLIRICCTKS